MNGADEGVPAWLGGFAEAAAVVLTTPSACRDAMLGALDRCWEDLQQVGGHRRPYAQDGAEVLARFDAARAALQHALRAAGAAGTVRAGGAVAAADAAAGSAAPAPVESADRTDTAPPDREDAGPAGPQPPAVDGAAACAGAPGPGPGPAPVAQPSPGGAGPGFGANAGSGQDLTPEQSAPVSSGPSAEALPGARPPGDGGPGPVDPATAVDPTASRGATAAAAGGPESPAGAGAQAEPEPDPLAGFAEALEALETDLLAEQIRYLPRTPPAPAADPGAGAADRVAATWQRVHMALLRLPDTLRQEWRARADEAAAAAGMAVSAEDSTDPDVIVPGLPQGLYAAERVPLAVTDPLAAARVPEEILLSLGTTPDAVTGLPATDPRPAWAVRAEQAIRLVELDPELHVAVLVEEQPSVLASPDARLRYRRHLDRLLGSAGSSQANRWPADGRLGAAHNLDMVLGGLVHKRPAAPGSWWWHWRTGVSLILAPLAENAGYELVTKPVKDWRKPHIDSYAVKETVPGVGQAEEPLVQWVVWTPLKPKSFSAKNERKGRVVIRPATHYGRQAAP
ncbi:hypothetical protein [Streptomyces yangpuensis]|uniref:hypothetical protein n=1 Tax=Streptomyces yangpuensis TaxID=1648182 RepID=UPI0036885830